MDPLTLIALAAGAGFVFRKAWRNLHPQAGPGAATPIVAAARHPSEAGPDLAEIEVLPEYRLAEALVRAGFKLIFVTGGAGTGKSTFIQWLAGRFPGRALLAAPTGVAALNIGGSTLHSLCRLPLGRVLRSEIKLDSHRAELLEAQVLIVDEISMVHAHLLDAVSCFFRKNRPGNLAFGGLPVVVVGDLFQLPPVVDAKVRELIDAEYEGLSKFLDAKALVETTYFGIELTKTYRQSDQAFVDLLTELREGRNLEATVAALNAGCAILELPPPGAVWLTPRVAEADSRNAEALTRLEGEAHLYRGQRLGKFAPAKLPSPLELRLKLGAQVLFTQNDKDKRWVNGTVGIVRELGEERLTVEIPSTGRLCQVEQTLWTDFDYAWNAQTRKIERVVIGSYRQFPLVLAWAMTIHKSQGKTISRVHVDLGRGAFAPGQVYVAMSRCRAMSGLSLARPLAVADVHIDREAVAYYDRLRESISKLPPQRMLESLEGAPASRPGADDVPW
jgi:ATP-dependent DNA helicase PIF1